MIKDEFISNPNKKYKFKIGKNIATALMGFIIGFCVAALVLIPLILWMR